MICARLGVDGEPRGVLSVASATPDLWTEEDLHFVEAAARWVGMVAARAELSQRLADQAEEQGRRAAADELIAILAHDLRNHLAPFRGRLQLLHRAINQDSQAAALRQVDELGRSVDRLGRLVSDLLDSARLEHGLFTLDRRASDLVSLARETATALGTTPDRIQVTTCEEEVWAVVDPERLRQAVENLLANALKFSPEAVPVTVHVGQEQRPDGSWGLVTVSDQGPGIPSELQARLFERFATGRESPGLGLGLYLARRVAEAHGGTLTLDSSVGSGARFTLAVPVEYPLTSDPT
jgi:signal transduction histidine kinase